jgi:nucleoid-associated protein YgaU
MDMGKYVAIGVLAVIVLAAVTYEAPQATLAKTAEQSGQFGGTFGEAPPPPPEEPALPPLPSTGELPAPVEMGAVQSPTETPVAEAAPTSQGENVRQLAKYTVKAGQSLCDIAEELLGDRNRWKEVWKQNKDRLPNPDTIREGMTIVFDAAKGASVKLVEVAKTPKEAKAQPATEATVAGRAYRVAKGDTLYAIASRELGKGSRWQEIVSLNQLPSEQVTAGTMLKLPSR